MEFYDYGDAKACIFEGGPDRFAIEYVGGTLNDSLQILCDNDSKVDAGPSSVEVDLGELIEALEKIASVMGCTHTATALDDAARAYRMEKS